MLKTSASFNLNQITLFKKNLILFKKCLKEMKNMKIVKQLPVKLLNYLKETRQVEMLSKFYCEIQMINLTFSRYVYTLFQMRCLKKYFLNWIISKILDPAGWSALNFKNLF